MRRKTKKAEPDKGDKKEKGDKGPDRPAPAAAPAPAPEDFVARLVRDPSRPPQLQLLSGYLGASSVEGHVRLYTDVELGGYVEIPADAIRHTQELPRGRAPLGVSLVWVERGAGLFQGRAVQARATHPTHRQAS